MRRLGVHTSIAGGIHLSLERAHALGCATLQIFSHNPRVWAVRERDEEELSRFRRLRAEYGLSPVFVHTSYLVNLATASPDLKRRSIDMTILELDSADAIGADYVIIHTGSASGERPGIARARAVESLGEIASRGKWKAGLLLENTAGERGDITSTIEDIAEIARNVTGGLIAGICLDTCHAFAAGYDLSSDEGIHQIAAEIETHISRQRLRLIHLNDSKGSLGSGIDRHEHIGRGRIGPDGMRRVIRHEFFSGIPLILETPKKTDEDDPRNLALVRKLAAM